MLTFHFYNRHRIRGSFFFKKYCCILYCFFCNLQFKSSVLVVRAKQVPRREHFNLFQKILLVHTMHTYVYEFSDGGKLYKICFKQEALVLFSYYYLLSFIPPSYYW